MQNVLRRKTAECCFTQNQVFPIWTTAATLSAQLLSKSTSAALPPEVAIRAGCSPVHLQYVWHAMPKYPTKKVELYAWLSEAFTARVVWTAFTIFILIVKYQFN